MEKSKEAANEDIYAGRNVRYRVNFPLLNPLPVLTGLKYNGRLICSGRPEVVGPGEQFATIQLHHTLHTTVPTYQVLTRPVVQQQQPPSQNQPPSQTQPQSPPQSSSNNPYQSNPFLAGLFTQHTRPKPQSNGQSPSTTQDINYQWVPTNQQPPSNPGSNGYPNNGPQSSWTVYVDNEMYPVQSGGDGQILDLLQPNNNDAVKPVKPQSQPTIGPNFWVSEPTTTTPFIVITQPVPPSTTTALAPVASVEDGYTFLMGKPGDHSYKPDECGNPIPSLNTLAIGGEQTKRGEWPWIVAIYKQKIKSSTLQLDYYCSGTLVSRDVVITAAHCIRTTKGEVVSLNEVTIHIGRNNLADLTEQGIIIQKPKQIEPHPDYKIWDTSSTTSDADIAVIRLREHVRFTQYIRPACLWEATTNVDDIVDRRGVVVGWGRDESGEVTNIPTKVFLSPVTNDVCIKSNDVFEYIVSPRTFCASGKNASGPCNGDSGAGWLLKRGDGKWYLRGVVSSSLTDPDRNNLCDLKNYVVFSDTARFTYWIKKFL